MKKKNYFVHENAICETERIGEGTRIWAFTHVMKGAAVGKGCNIGEGVFIESGARLGNYCTIKNGVQIWNGVTLEDYVFLGPNATLTNDINPRSKFKKAPQQLLKTLIKEGATIGANATILCGITIGRYAFIGAGSVVTKNIRDYALVYGSPAKLKGYICECGRKIVFGHPCICGRRYKKTKARIIPIS